MNDGDLKKAIVNLTERSSPRLARVESRFEVEEEPPPSGGNTSRLARVESQFEVEEPPQQRPRPGGGATMRSMDDGDLKRAIVTLTERSTGSLANLARVESQFEQHAGSLVKASTPGAVRVAARPVPVSSIKRPSAKSSSPNLVRCESSGEFILSVVQQRAHIVEEEEEEDTDAFEESETTTIGVGQPPQKKAVGDRAMMYALDDNSHRNNNNAPPPPQLQRVQAPPGAYSAQGEAMEPTEGFDSNMIQGTPRTLPSFRFWARRSHNNNATAMPLGTIQDTITTLHEESNEEGQAQHPPPPIPKRQWDKTTVAILIGGILLIVVAIVVAVVVLQKIGDSDASSLSGKPPTTAPTDLSVSSTDRLLSLLPQSTLEALDDFQSPQAQAFEWILEESETATMSDQRLLQRYAMAVFFFAMDGISWKRRQNWLNHDAHECLWYQRDVFEEPKDNEDEDQEAEERIPPCPEMEDNNLQINDEGTIQRLWLWDNKVQGVVPPELFLGLSNLTSIHLGKDGWRGTLPTELFGLSKLTACPMGNSQLTGTVPTQIGLSKLDKILLNGNQLTGTIPTQLGLLQNVTHLSLERNPLEGKIPTQLGNMDSLWALEIYETLVTGTIPSELGVIDTLWHLDLENNTLTGTIPTQLGSTSAHALEHLLLRGNPLLEGTIPPHLCSINRTLFDCNRTLCGCSKCACPEG